MINKMKIFGRKPFVRNVIIMATGSLAAQAITLLLSPFITRLYGPEAFGLMGAFLAIVGIITPIAALTYPIAIVLPKKDSEAKGLIKISLIVSFVISLVTALVLLVFTDFIVEIFHLNSNSPFLILIPIVILFSAFLQVIEQWLIRTKQFSITAKVVFYQAVILQSTKVGIGIFYPAASVLIILSSIAIALKALMLYSRTRKSFYKEVELEENSGVNLIDLIKKYKDFPIYRAPEVFINAISQSLPILVLTSFFGPAAAGFYTIGKNVLNVPSQLIGKSVGDVFYPRVSDAANKGENLTELIKKATFSLGVVGFIPYLLVILFGPELFGLIFGAQWVTAGEYARWISLWSFFGFINKPSVKSLPVLGAQKFQLNYTIFMLVIRIVSLGIGYYIFSSDVVAIALFSISGALLNIGLIVITLYISKKHDKKNKVI